MNSSEAGTSVKQPGIVVDPAHLVKLIAIARVVVETHPVTFAAVGLPVSTVDDIDRRARRAIRKANPQPKRHPTPRERCKGVIGIGKPCKFQSFSNGYCGHHSRQDPDAPSFTR